LLDEQRIGTRVDGEAVDLFAENHAAGARRPFEYHERRAAAVQLVRGREARDSGADDGDVIRHGEENPSVYDPLLPASPRIHQPGHRMLRTISSSAAMKVGDVLSDSVRRSAAPDSAAVAAACTSTSNRISV